MYELVGARIESVNVLVDSLGLSRLPASLQTLGLEVVVWNKRDETFRRGWKLQRRRERAVIRWICDCGEVERWRAIVGKAVGVGQ